MKEVSVHVRVEQTQPSRDCHNNQALKGATLTTCSKEHDLCRHIVHNLEITQLQGLIVFPVKSGMYSEVRPGNLPRACHVRRHPPSNSIQH